MKMKKSSSLAVVVEGLLSRRSIRTPDGDLSRRRVVG
jgi:hypothetical protein